MKKIEEFQNYIREGLESIRKYIRPDKGDKLFPEALLQLQNTYYLLACGALLVMIIIMIYEKNIGFALGFLFPFVFMIMGKCTELNFYAGRYNEQVLTCVSSRKKYSISANSKECRVMFTDNADPPHLYEMFASYRADAFVANAVYIVYTRKDAPKRILAFTAI